MRQNGDQDVRRLVNFLRVELSSGLTYATLAMAEYGDAAKRQQHEEAARKAVDRVRGLIALVRIDHFDVEGLRSSLEKLERMLECLGADGAAKIN
jgi:hypothetical protein